MKAAFIIGLPSFVAFIDIHHGRELKELLMLSLVSAIRHWGQDLLGHWLAGWTTNIDLGLLQRRRAFRRKVTNRKRVKLSVVRPRLWRHRETFGRKVVR